MDYIIPNHKVGSVKKNSYRLDKNLLSIKTECGEYKFTIDDETGLANAQRIAELMVKEMERVEKNFKGVREKLNSYAKLLLSNLNLSDRYIQLEDRHNNLLKKHQEMREFYQRQCKSGDAYKEIIEKKKIFLKENISEDLKSITEILYSSQKKEIPGAEKEALPEEGSTQPLAEPQLPADTLEDQPEDQPENKANLVEPQAKPVAEAEPSIGPEPEPFTPPEPLEEIPRPIEPQAKPETEIIPSILTEPEPFTPPAPLEEIPQKIAPRTIESQAEPETEVIPSIRTEPEAFIPPGYLEQPPSSSQFIINTQKVTPDNSIEYEKIYNDEFQLPSLGFLKSVANEIEVDHEAIRRDAELLEQKLGYFGIKGEVMAVSPGPVITTFEYKPAPGIKISKIVNLADDLALALSALSIRIVAPIPGKDVIGIEIPNKKMSMVPFIDIVSSDDFINNESPMPICLGKDIIGNPVVVELEKMPHLLIAGATGTGKSVGLNAMIASILYKSSPDRVKFIMIDPKRIELSMFNDIPHLITPVITDMKKATTALQWVVREMERRYEILARAQARNINQYNEKVKTMEISEYDEDETFEEFPYIVIIIDELADLMMTASKDIEFSLTRIAQMARAAGIHMILATQRPSVDVLTGIIKANFPTRISFQVSSKTDSRTIIDANGAETLLGRGDMLFVPPGTARLTRVHGTYLSEEELISITNFLKAQGKPRYLLEVTTEKEEEATMDVGSEDDYDEKYQAALEYVLSTRQASISSVQRALRVGYNRAARIIDLMEKKGIIGQSDGIKPRQVLVNHGD